MQEESTSTNSLKCFSFFLFFFTLKRGEKSPITINNGITTSPLTLLYSIPGDELVLKWCGEEEGRRGGGGGGESNSVEDVTA